MINNSPILIHLHISWNSFISECSYNYLRRGLNISMFINKAILYNSYISSSFFWVSIDVFNSLTSSSNLHVESTYHVWNFCTQQILCFVYSYLLMETEEFYFGVLKAMNRVENNEVNVIIDEWGFLSVPHLLWHGASIYNGHL